MTTVNLAGFIAVSNREENPLGGLDPNALTPANLRMAATTASKRNRGLGRFQLRQLCQQRFFCQL